MFGIGEKDSDGRQVRIGHRGRHLRASRTGGASLRAQAKAAGMRFTVNTKHGTRVSRRVAKGTNLALQGGAFRLRGRYGRGATKLNLSKSGASVSTKNRLGTFNWTAPRRSSAKVAGVQVRGKRAAQMQTVYLLATGIISLFGFILIAFRRMLHGFALVLDFLARLVAEVSLRAWSLARSGIQRLADRRARGKRDRQLAFQSGESERVEADTVSFAVLLFGAGIGNAAPQDRERGLMREALSDVCSGEGTEEGRCSDAEIDNTSAVLGGRDSETAMGELAERYARGADSAAILETFFRLDRLLARSGTRTKLQDELLDIYCERTGVSLEAVPHQRG